MAVPPVQPAFGHAFNELRRWSDEVARLHDGEIATLRDECNRWKQHSWGQEKEIERLRERLTAFEQKAPAGKPKPSTDAPGPRGLKRSAIGAEPPPVAHSVPLPPPPAAPSHANTKGAGKGNDTKGTGKGAVIGRQEGQQSNRARTEDEVLGYYVGVIKTSFDRGYGFIQCDDLQKDVCVHQRNLGDFDPQMGAPVEFEAYMNKGRLQGRYLQVPSNKAGARAQNDDVLGDFVGTIKNFNHEKGFGFIICNAVQNENNKPDVYIHMTNCRDADVDLQPDTPVLFEAFWLKGRLQGRNLQVPPKGSKEGPHKKVNRSEGANQSAEEVVGDYVGVIKNFNSQKGFGFITCNDLQNEEHKSDVYIHPANIGDFDMQPGAPVVFEAYWRKGRLQGRHMETPREENDDGAQGAQGGQGPQGDGDQDEIVGEFVGVVKNYNVGKGFGFITCDALLNEAQVPDIFIHKRMVGDFDMEVGAPVEFQAFWNKGRLQGRHLRIPSENQEGDGAAEEDDEFLGEHVGVIKAWKADKKYGFIACDALQDVPQNKGQRDVFLHRKFVGNFPMEVGLEVKFEAFKSKGQIQARSLEHVESAGRPAKRVKKEEGEPKHVL